MLIRLLGVSCADLSLKFNALMFHWEFTISMLAIVYLTAH